MEGIALVSANDPRKPGRLKAEDAFRYVAGVLRPQDVVCVGYHLGDDPDLIEKTVGLFERIVQPAVA